MNATILSEIDKLSFNTAWDKEEFEGIIENKNCYIEVVKEKDKIVGYVILLKLFESSEIIRLAVIPEFRGKGYGKLLVERAIDISKEMNVNDIWLEVRKSNKIAINIYEKFGFKLISTRKRYYEDNGEDALVYVKKIKN